MGSKIKAVINKHPNISTLLLFAILSFLLILPYLHGPAYQHNPGWDGRFHISRIAESYLNLKAGHMTQINPSMMTKTFGSFGYPENMFYPIFTLLPEAFLQVIVGNAYLAYLIFVALIFFLTFTSMYVVTLKLTHNRYTALLSSILYGFGHFTLTITLFYRSFGGSFAFIFIPIAFLGMYQIAVGDYKQWWLLSLGVTGLIFSDLPDACVALLLLMLCFFATLTLSEPLKVKWFRLLRLVYAGILTGCLTAFFLLPLMQNLLFVKNISVNKLILSKTTYALTSLFITSNIASYSLGILGIILFVCVAIRWHKFQAPLKYYAVIMLLSVILASNVFPWPIFDKYFSFIQFVGRFLYFATFLSSLLGAIALKDLITNKHNRLIIISLFGLIGLMTATSLNFNIKHNPENNAVTIVKWQDFQKSTLNNYVYDYLPKQSVGLKYQLEQHNIPAINPNQNIQQLSWSTGYNVIHYQISSKQANQRLLLPNIYYPGFHTYVNDKEMTTKYTKENLIAVAIKKGHNKIDIRYKNTPVRIFANWLSLVSWLILIIIGSMKIIKAKHKS